MIKVVSKHFFVFKLLLFATGLLFFNFSKGNVSTTIGKKIDSLNSHSRDIAPFNTEKSLEYANHALELSKKYKYTHGLIEALINIATVERNTGNYAAAFEKIKEALRLAYNENDKSAIAQGLYSFGDLQKILGNLYAAIPYFKNAYSIYFNISDHLHETMCLNNLAHVNMDIGQKEHKTTYYHKAIQIYKATVLLSEKYHLPLRKTIAYVNLANAYNVIGKETKNRNYFDTSLTYSNKSFELATYIKDSSKQAISLSNMGEVMESLNKLNEAISFYQNAIAIYEKLKESNRIVLIANHIADVLIKQNKYDKAHEYLLMSIEQAKQQNHKPSLMRGYELLAGIYQKQNDFVNAFNCLKKMDLYKDSIMFEKNTLANARMQVELEMQKKDREIQILNKNKEIKEAQYNSSLLFRNGLIIGCVILALALLTLYYRYQEKKQFAAQLLMAKNEAEHARIMQEQFLANTSHEIRTPMNGIIGMTQQLSELNLNAKQKEYLDAIQESANHLLVIINDLLDISQMKAGKMIFQNNAFSLFELVKNTRLLFEQRCREKGIAFEIIFDKNIPDFLIGDKIRIAQIINNLIANAVKFTEKGIVSFKITAGEIKNKKVNITFIVTDTGIGIPLNKQQYIFESFAQADAKTNRKFGGTGLGLTICKQLIDQMGGLIQLESKPEKGSVFKVELSFETSDALIYHNKQKKKHDLNELKILVVDDNKLNRLVAKLTLNKWNCHVYIADSAKEAFKILNSINDIALILMDITMPEMDGFEATSFIKTNYTSTYANCPIVAMTASAFTGDKEKCMAMGMDDYISKPFDPEELYELIIRNCTSNNKTKKGITDFTLLYEKADGDIDYLIDIMSLYLEEMPIYINELLEITQKKLRTELKNQAHKMKSPVGLFGANDLKNQLQQIELKVLEKGVTAELVIQIESIKAMCEKSITEVQNELNKILVEANAK